MGKVIASVNGNTFVQPHVAKGREMGLDHVRLVVEETGEICIDLEKQKENQTNVDHGVVAGSEKSASVDDSLDAEMVNVI